MNESTETHGDSTRPRRRWLRRIGAAYLALLILSHVTVWIVSSISEERLPAGVKTVEVPRMNAEGSVDGRPVSIAYREHGPADATRTLIALHGAPTAGYDFRYLGEILSDDIRVISPFMPGYGGSSTGVPDYGIEANAHYTLAFMDVLGIDKADVFGFSQGSGVALEMYDEQPDRIESIIFYGGIGVQEFEGSGDYNFEHLKYAVGYALGVYGVDLIPHFGLVPDRAWRIAALRNFTDTDHRPLRGVFEKMNKENLPFLILQGEQDFLVFADGAREHHNIVEHSELVMYPEGSHFMLFSEGPARILAQEIKDFLDRTDDPGFIPTRRTIDPGAAKSVTNGEGLPANIGVTRGMGVWQQFFAIGFATWVLEDLACISTGMLIHRGSVDFFLGALACWVGIYLGDFALWLVGRFFIRRLLRYRWVRKRVPESKLQRFGEWFDRSGWIAVIASRFIPGTRLPLYLAAGATGHKPVRFALWTLIAVTIWVPFILIITILLGETFVKPFEAVFGRGWLSLLVGACVILLMIRYMPMILMPYGRKHLWARVSRIWRHEFWPFSVFYAPVFVWQIWLVVKYRSLTVWTLCDPFLPPEQVIFESKQFINDRLPVEWSMTSILIAADEQGDAEQRTAFVRKTMEERGWTYPIVLKPDRGCRGMGVKVARNEHDVFHYFEFHTAETVLQQYAFPPCEAGIFYVRRPSEGQGRIFAVTLKSFPFIVGDGVREVEQIILDDKRLRMQHRVYAIRHEAVFDHVLPEGERLNLTTIGNHAQGCEFRDGGHMITPELERSIDAIARTIDGFYFGRFDVRYDCEQDLKAGRHYIIIELNGPTSEATNVYDPTWSIFQSYGVLFEQWSLVFAIGDEVRRTRELRPPGLWHLFRHGRMHYRHRKAKQVADG